jgi:hypothetical protein
MEINSSRQLSLMQSQPTNFQVTFFYWNVSHFVALSTFIAFEVIIFLAMPPE